MDSRSIVRRPQRSLLTAAVAAALLAVVVPAARAQAPAVRGELIPSIGISKTLHTGDDTARLYGGLAVRAAIVPALRAEIGVAYRQEEEDGLEVRQWPVTASLWIVPIPMLYAGGGVGWYHTSYDFTDELDESSSTKQRFGAHLGGGLQVPLVPRLAVDLNGRYVFLENEDLPFFDEDRDPDFWTVTAGLAIGF